ncbi:hypothetical protein EYF80_016052 [Liparis tanakae]|uniref:Uncharacterized protein n=1 Tax=Liparis tanakae TaxID=230148 RepID=A0A4Z2I8G6_9TELE|nr:hypothetical protein EYF80_016052 [Liparis tanakae]
MEREDADNNGPRCCAPLIKSARRRSLHSGGLIMGFMQHLFEGGGSFAVKVKSKGYRGQTLRQHGCQVVKAVGAETLAKLLGAPEKDTGKKTDRALTRVAKEYLVHLKYPAWSARRLPCLGDTRGTYVVSEPQG